MNNSSSGYCFGYTLFGGFATKGIKFLNWERFGINRMFIFTSKLKFMTSTYRYVFKGLLALLLFGIVASCSKDDEIVDPTSKPDP